MLERAWSVAVLDSGIEPLPLQASDRVKRFVDEGDQVLERAPIEDPIGHGTVVAGIIVSSPRPVELLVAQVLNERGRSTAATLATAVDWAVSRGAGLLHFSLGLAHDRAVLGAAIGRAIAAGVLVVAAAPARGAATYPASYPGVIRATGDARCGKEQISYLGTGAADFGACPMHHAHSGKVSRGASVGAAHLSRYIVTHMPAGLPVPMTHEGLVRFATFHGPERHQPMARA
jgi:subtilisin family serine protease